MDVAGRQQHDGTYTQHINVWVEEGGALDAVAARWLAAQLMDAADLLDE